MRERFPAALGVLVVVVALTTSATVGPVTAHPDNSTNPSSPAVTPVVAVANTTGYLELAGNGVQRQEYGNADLDVAGAVAMDSGELHDRYLGRKTFAAFGDAPNTSARTELLRRTATELENRTRALQRKQRMAIRQYTSGAISTGTLLRRLAIVDARSDRVKRVVDRILRDTSWNPDYSLPPRLQIRFQNIQAKPIFLQGPLRNRVGASITGERRPVGVYVRTTDEGIVLAQTLRDRYIREAFDGSAYRQGATDQFRQSEEATITVVRDRARVLYPWAFENTITTTGARGTGFGLTSVYRVTVDHSQGQLVSYLDGSTKDVFREIQSKQLSRLPISGTATRRTGNLTIRANLTHPTGPMEVTVRDPERNTTVDARIAVGGTTVGHTGDDGSLWTIQPAGLSAINATTADHSAEVALGV